MYRYTPALSTSAVTITGAVSAVHWGPRQGTGNNTRENTGDELV